MTDEQIKKLAREYVEDKRSDVLAFFPTPLPDSMEVLVREEQESVIKVIEWLLKAYCIVEKSDIKRYYNVDKCTIRDYRKRCGDKAQTRAAARIRLCESLFGKELFNEDEP